MEFVTFEIAKKLKEKGFKDKCYKHYYPDSPDWFLSSYLECNNYSDYVEAPTISQVLKWLREEKNIVVSMYPHYHYYCGKNINTYWCWDAETPVYTVDMTNVKQNDFGSYEQAALAGIEYALDNLI